MRRLLLLITSFVLIFDLTLAKTDNNTGNEILLGKKRYAIESVSISGIKNKLLGKTNCNLNFTSKGKAVVVYLFFEFSTLEGPEGSYNINNTQNRIINAKISGYTWIDSGQIKNETDLVEAECEIKRNTDNSYFIKLIFFTKSGDPIEVQYNGDINIVYAEV